MCQFITVKEMPALGYLYIMYEHKSPGMRTVQYKSKGRADEVHKYNNTNP